MGVHPLINFFFGYCAYVVSGISFCVILCMPSLASFGCHVQFVQCCTLEKGGGVEAG